MFGNQGTDHTYVGVAGPPLVDGREGVVLGMPQHLGKAEAYFLAQHMVLLLENIGEQDNP